jgi:CheY-like chemotaxis protein
MKHITIVDDAPDLGRVLQTLMLTITKDLVISVVPSAEEAMLYSGRHAIDLLVTDIRLPGISGLDLVKKIRSRHPDVKVIFITGLSDGPLVRQARDLEADYFFYKPLDFPEFLAAVRKCLDLPDTGSLLIEPARPVAAPPPSPVSAPPAPPASIPLATTPLAPAAPPVQVPEVAKAGEKLAARLGAALAPAEAPKELFAEIIASLRQGLGAMAVFVMNESGHIVAQAGALPEIDLEANWALSLFAALSSAEKVSRLIKGQAATYVQGYIGKDFDLAIAPLGDLAMLAVLPKGRSGLRLALAFEELQAAQEDLDEIFNRMGVGAAKPAEPAKPEPEPAPKPVTKAPPVVLEPDPELKNLEQLIARSGGQIKPEDADAFWESSPDAGKPSISSPDMITYDQAAKLGLAPKEGQ